MRILGMILVIAGALALGCQEFLSNKREAGWNVAIPPVMGGIAVTSGLILITSSLKAPDSHTRSPRPSPTKQGGGFRPSYSNTSEY